MTVIDLGITPRLEPKRKGGVCQCLSVYTVEATRMLECRSCGAVIDPFDFLWNEARKQENIAFSVRHLRNEQKRMQAEVEALKKQRANLKAQVRRLVNK